MTEKLQKVLARAGLGSRRELETWISAGRVKVNHVVATLGDRVNASDRIEVDGRCISRRRLQQVAPRVLAYHKDVGSVCSRSDPEARPTVFDRLPKLNAGRWIAVGRLDINTTGLLLMTTDGELANRLMHPAQEIEREYLVRILGKVSDQVLHQLVQGVQLDDGPAAFSSVVDTGGEGANHWYRVVLNEGRNREVRRLWESQGLTVSRLSRIRFGPIALQKNLRRGQSQELTTAQIKALYKTAGLKPPEPTLDAAKPAGAKRRKPASQSKRTARQRR